jgi:indolepyruvate ferredoxin oxidoreductase
MGAHTSQGPPQGAGVGWTTQLAVKPEGIVVALADFSLEDRYAREEGQVAMSGVQALLRVLLDQIQADRRAGLDTAAMVSGYRGSPLGGVDAMMNDNKPQLDAHNITFIPGLNEDLGATAVWGSQLANRNFEGKYDGVLGMWYGKAPGVDRSGDAIRHANVCGVDPKGGVLLVAGDDPASKSSTLAAQSEVILQHFQTPILYPGSVQEVADYGRVGYAMSRYTGLWTALKIVTNVADGYSTISVGPDRVKTVRPDFEWNGQPFAHTQQDSLVGASSVRMEMEIHEGRLPAVDAFTLANKLNTMSGATGDAKLGIVAAGKTYYDLLEALDKMGLTEADLAQRGIRLYKPAVIWPLESTGIKEFAAGLDTIVFVEEKRGFLEGLTREILYGVPNAPQVFGKRNAAGDFWFPGHGEMDSELIGRKLRPFLTEMFGSDVVGPIKQRIVIPVALSDGKEASRAPGFCSGCPHNRSTWVPEGSEAGGGIGCHGMASMTPTRNTNGTTQMGGEGIQWVGAAPFVTMNHRFQNIGDGTYHHSGSLALRQSIATNTNITYKILYNGAVAMTGGQDIDGQMAVPALTRSIHAEGPAKIMVVTDDVNKYPSDDKFAPDTDVWHRDRLDEAQLILRDIPGTTVLIYDQACAAELRRDRKRGTVVDPAMRVFINEAVCEGCGDCGEKSSCLSVQPIETEFGRKTMIHQSSCNKDYTCMDGDCPAFVEVIPGGEVKQKDTVKIDKIGSDLPEPDRIDEGNIVMMGIGGTGVVTINQTLATAALLDGKFATGLDQTGLAQKGGPVVSNLKIRKEEGSAAAAANKVSIGEADAYLVFDLLTGVSKLNLERASNDRTIAVVSSTKVPTGQMVRDTKAAFPQWDGIKERLEAATRSEQNIYFDAAMLSDNLFRSTMPANMLVLGAAYQRGVIPISSAAIEKAIDLNGVAVDTNVQAFRVGRKIALDPNYVDSLGIERVGRVKRSEAKASKKAQQLIDSVSGSSTELQRLMGIRVPDLIAYQDQAYAQDYVDFLGTVVAAEAAAGTDTAFSEAVGRYLYKIMAYKDEYEVARLHRSKEFQAAIREQFGDDTKVTYKLHPPVLRAAGMKKKIGLGKSGDAAFIALQRMKKLRGKAADPFGRTSDRKMERELIGEYRGMIERCMAMLASDYETAVEVAELPDMIRGYESIKEANVAAFREKAQHLLK